MQSKLKQLIYVDCWVFKILITCNQKLALIFIVKYFNITKKLPLYKTINSYCKRITRARKICNIIAYFPGKALNL